MPAHRDRTLHCLIQSYEGLPDLPFHDKTITGRICFNFGEIALGQVISGQKIGIKQMNDSIWPINFIDTEYWIEPVEISFDPELLPMSPE